VTPVVKGIHFCNLTSDISNPGSSGVKHRYT
jgi:hypothetical protein